MWLIVGLGNPGEKYTSTRHNIGFQCVNHFAKQHALEFGKQRSQARIAEGNVDGQRICLAKPSTFMNNSGHAVSGLCNWYKIDQSEALLIVYDDMDLPFGTIRIRQRGGPGTHNGMRSIVSQLGTQAFPRLRIGIGSPPPGWDAAAYVLGRFREEERERLPALYERVTEIIEVILRDDLTTAMNRYNRQE